MTLPETDKYTARQSPTRKHESVLFNDETESRNMHTFDGEAEEASTGIMIRHVYFENACVNNGINTAHQASRSINSNHVSNNGSGGNNNSKITTISNNGNVHNINSSDTGDVGSSNNANNSGISNDTDNIDNKNNRKTTSAGKPTPTTG